MGSPGARHLHGVRIECAHDAVAQAHPRAREPRRYRWKSRKREIIERRLLAGEFDAAILTSRASRPTSGSISVSRIHTDELVVVFGADHRFSCCQSLGARSARRRAARRSPRLPPRGGSRWRDGRARADAGTFGTAATIRVGWPNWSDQRIWVQHSSEVGGGSPRARLSRNSMAFSSSTIPCSRQWRSRRHSPGRRHACSSMSGTLVRPTSRWLKALQLLDE